MRLTLQTPQGQTLTRVVPLVSMPTPGQAEDPGNLRAWFNLHFVVPLNIPVSERRPGFFFFWHVNRAANYAVLQQGVHPGDPADQKRRPPRGVWGAQRQATVSIPREPGQREGPPRDPEKSGQRPALPQTQHALL